MNKKGFTLVELLAVIALVAILSGIAVPNVISSINNSRKNQFLLDAKRMVAKAEYLLSEKREYRTVAKTSGKIFKFSDLNQEGEFQNDSDGGGFDTNSFVKVTFNTTNNKYQYCICVIGSKRKITNTSGTCNSSSGSGCIMSDSLTGIDVIKDK